MTSGVKVAPAHFANTHFCFCPGDETRLQYKGQRYVNSPSPILDRKEQNATTGPVSSKCLTANIHVVGSSIQLLANPHFSSTWPYLYADSAT